MFTVIYFLLLTGICVYNDTTEISTITSKGDSLMIYLKKLF